MQLNNTWLNRATLLVCGIFNEKKKKEEIYGSFMAYNLQGMEFVSIRADFYQGTLKCFPKKEPVPLLYFNSPSSDFLALKLAQKSLQQYYGFLFF